MISFNRARWLRRAVESYRQLSRPVRIVIHDNGSNDPETLEALEAFRREGVAVRRHPQITTPGELDGVDRTVQAYFDGRPPAPYVVTDCDVDLSCAQPEALDVYHELLERFVGAACVGPMLRISDIRQDYPLFNRVMNRHVRQFWGRTPDWITASVGPVAYIQAKIDTTFALHRAGEPFRRWRPGIRVYHPYEAIHLDWTATPEDRGPYFDVSSPAISHWNNREQFLVHSDDPLEVNEYIVVEQDPNGGLTTRVKHPISDNPPGPGPSRR